MRATSTSAAHTHTKSEHTPIVEQRIYSGKTDERTHTQTRQNDLQNARLGNSCRCDATICVTCVCTQACAFGSLRLRRQQQHFYAQCVVVIVAVVGVVVVVVTLARQQGARVALAFRFYRLSTSPRIDIFLLLIYCLSL